MKGRRTGYSPDTEPGLTAGKAQKKRTAVRRRNANSDFIEYDGSSDNSSDEFIDKSEEDLETSEDSDEITIGNQPYSDNSYSSESEIENIHRTKEKDIGTNSQKTVETPTIDIIYTHKIDALGEKSYLCKIVGQHFSRPEWITDVQSESNKAKVESYLNSLGPTQSPPNPPFYNPEYDIPQRILDSQKKGHTTLYKVLWKGLSEEDATWETKERINNDIIINEFINGSINNKCGPKPGPSQLETISDTIHSNNGKALKPYQVDGVNFMARNWVNGQNIILGDDANLEKSVQVAAFLQFIFSKYEQTGPFVIIISLQSADQWISDLAEWTNMSVLKYYGNKSERKSILKNEFYAEDGHSLRFNIMLTTVQNFCHDQELFQSFPIKILIGQESVPYKNSTTQKIANFPSEHKIILTSTPYVEKIEELKIYLQFIDPKKYGTEKDISSLFDENLDEQHRIEKMTDIIRPFVLRRLKKDIIKSSQMEEIIIECPLTKIQKEMQHAVFQKYQNYLVQKDHTLKQSSDIIQDLFKIVQHPFIENQFAIAGNISNIVESCGKMIILDKLISKLSNNRIIIMFQSPQMMKILEDYFAFKNIEFLALDSLVRGEERTEILSKFEQNSSISIFLLNAKYSNMDMSALSSAQSIIIYESERNPIADLQKVQISHPNELSGNFATIYRLLSESSIDRIMFDIAISILLHDANANETYINQIIQENVEKIMKICTEAALNESDHTNLDINAIINKSQHLIHNHCKFNLSYQRKVTDINIEKPVHQNPPLPTDNMDFDNYDIGFNDIFNDNDYEDHQNFDFNLFTRNVAMKLVVFLMSFGVSRMDRFADYGGGSQIPQQMASIAMRVFINWMLAEADQPPGTFTVLEYYAHSNLTDVERKFADAKRSDLIDFVKESADKKLQAIQYAEFNHLICSSVQSESDIAIPSALPEKPFPWWSENYDQHLMYISWQRGTANVISADFKIDANIPQSVLRERFKQLMTGIADAFGELKRRVKGTRLSNEAVRTALNLITKKDHEAIVEYLTTMGYAGPKHLKDHTGISPSIDVIKQYVENVIAASNAMAECRTVNQESFAEVITPHMAHRIRSSISLMDDIRYFLSVNMRSEFVQKLKRIEAVGFEKASKDPYFAVDLGKDKSAANLQKVARFLIGNTRAPQKRPSSALTLSPSSSVDRFAAVSLHFPESTLQLPPQLQQFPPIIEPMPQQENSPQKKRYALSSQNSAQIMSPQKIVRQKPEVKPKKRAKIKEDPDKKPIHEIELRTVKEEPQQEQKPRRSKGGKVVDEYVLPPKIATNEPASDELPIRVSAAMVIISMGHVVYDRAAYHSERYIYPPGYVSEKLHTSLENPSERIWYRSKVLEDGDKPLFRVEVADNPEVYFEGPSPSTPWIKLIRQIEERKKELDLPHTARPSISGPESFGFTLPIVQRMMARLPNADRCVKFKQLNEYADDDEVMPSRGRKTVRFYELSSSSSSEEFQAEKKTNDAVTLRVNFEELIKMKMDDEIHLKFPDGSDFASFLGQH